MAATCTVPAAGCLESVPPTDGATETPVGRTPSEPEDPDCGPAELSVSELLSDDPGDPGPCFEGATPSFAVENEREEAVELDLELEAATTFEATYSLAPGERAVESRAFETAPDVAGTVTVDDETRTVSWPERSCHRYGVALLPDGVEIGWIEPLSGPGDTQHDCYPWADVPLEIGSAGVDRTITATVVDRCSSETTTETVSVAADERERIEDVLTSGGVYDVTIDVDDGDERTHTFRELCWGVVAGVGEDGEILLEQIPID